MYYLLEIVKEFKETVNLKHLHQNELDKSCLLMIQHILIVKIWHKELFQIRVE